MQSPNMPEQATGHDDVGKHSGNRNTPQSEHDNLPDAIRSESECAPVPQVAELLTSGQFINALKAATLDDGNLDEDVLRRLREPLIEIADVSDPDFRLSLNLFLSTANASEETYNNSRAAVLRHHPDDKILSYARIKSKIAELSGVIPIVHHMLSYFETVFSVWTRFFNLSNNFLLNFN
jgi:hypothetical protein